MAELDGISDTLRRQRKDINDALETTNNRTVETAELLKRVEELRRRAEVTQQAPAKDR